MQRNETHSSPLTPEQLVQWENDGYLLLKNVVPESIINGVRDRFAIVVDGIINELKEADTIDDIGTDLPFETRFLKVAGEHANRFGRSWRGQIATSEIFDLHYAEPLIDAIGQLTGTDVIGHPVFNARPKLPGQQLTVVPWHQDSGYFGTISEKSLIPTAWIPLVPVDETNGCLQVVAGSHKLGVVSHHTENREGKFLEVMDELIEESQIVTCPMEIGDALVFNNLTLHRSLPHTTSNIIRWAIDIRYLRDGDHPGSIYWKDPDFKWVIKSQSQPLTSLSDWLEMW
ncbi:phytanoyl-CoA dioxygenase family protein [Candidatus Poribacteria bacterium]|nr:phytanoyl-CoA dioxygenase family protein [Candidatus Poribacteria bacterium]